MDLLAVPDVIAGGAWVLVAEPVLEVEDVDALLAGPGGGGDAERVDADRGVQALRRHIPLDQVLDGPGGQRPPLEPIPPQSAGRLDGAEQGPVAVVADAGRIEPGGEPFEDLGG
jgi:hypothetical protein